MLCQNSVTTKSGTFTFFDEFVTHCQAEKKCKKRGEILAPVTNRKDANKIQGLFMSNVGIEGCRFVWNAGARYWLGLDETFTKNGKPKMFTNRLKWKERKHSRIYHNFVNNYTDCGIALYEPINLNDPFIIYTESAECSWEMQNLYACFKPAGDATAESIVEEHIKNEMAPSTGCVFAVGLIAGVAAGVGLLNRKHAKERAELNELRKSKKSDKEINSVCEVAVFENQ